MTAQTVGILLSVFSLLVALGIYWGGFVEEKRAVGDSEAASTKG